MGAKPTQFGRAEEMNTIERLKIVGKLHSMGMTPNQIAIQLDYSPHTAKKDVATIIDRFREFKDLDAYIKDVTARIGDQLQSLEHQRMKIIEQLEYASSWVADLEYFPDGSVIHKRDIEGNLLYGFKKASLVPTLVKALGEIDKQKGELLGLYSKNVDISVTLEQTSKTQVLILEVIKEASPETYSMLIRRIKAVSVATGDQKALMMNKVEGKTVDDYVEADFVEVQR